MNNFIEVHIMGKPMLINLAWVQSVRKMGYGAQIFLAFATPKSTSRNYLLVDESYVEIRGLIWN